MMISMTPAGSGSPCPRSRRRSCRSARIRSPQPFRRPRRWDAASLLPAGSKARETGVAFSHTWPRGSAWLTAMAGCGAGTGSPAAPLAHRPPPSISATKTGSKSLVTRFWPPTPKLGLRKRTAATAAAAREAAAEADRLARLRLREAETALATARTAAAELAGRALAIETRLNGAADTVAKLAADLAEARTQGEEIDRDLTGLPETESAAERWRRRGRRRCRRGVRKPMRVRRSTS